MLKFLTHKLRTHSLNEDPNQEKVDDDHDSGTESDDEFQDDAVIINEPSSRMESPASPGATDSAVPSDTDFGASTTAFGFPQRDPSDEIDEKSEGRVKQATSSSPSSSLLLLSSSSSPSPSCLSLSTTATVAAAATTTTTTITTTTTATISTTLSSTTAAAVLRLQTCKSSRDTDMLLNYNDQHSSEEELEVINSPKIVALQGCRPATAPEKRKWSQISNSNGGQGHCSKTQQQSSQLNQQIIQKQQQQQQHISNENGGIIGTCSAPPSRAGRDPAGSGSSDDEVQGLLGSTNGSVIGQPVQFRTSPPVDAHKPGRSLSPPPKLFHASLRDTRPPPRPRSRPRHHHLYHHHHHHHHHHLHNHYDTDADTDTMSACSPRKRHRPPHRQPRPCLDFEKMQQLKARAVTAWRHSGDHASELSVFCW